MPAARCARRPAAADELPCPDACNKGGAAEPMQQPGSRLDTAQAWLKLEHINGYTGQSNLAPTFPPSQVDPQPQALTWPTLCRPDSCFAHLSHLQSAHFNVAYTRISPFCGILAINCYLGGATVAWLARLYRSQLTTNPRDPLPHPTQRLPFTSILSS